MEKNMNIKEYENSFSSKNTLQYQYFQILKDRKWHCRKCDAAGIPSDQLAGGGGVQGLQRGTKTRPGLNIESKTQHCERCGSTGRWDRWDGTFKESNSASGLPKALQNRILEEYNYTDTIEERKRQSHELVIDHRFPMERWGESEDSNPSNMSTTDIRKKFQLLKKDGSGNHNLLKSRACERCINTGKRGYPIAIKFYYEGTEDWPTDCPASGKEAQRGCIGCGWYDFDKWRIALNAFLQNTKE